MGRWLSVQQCLLDKVEEPSSHLWRSCQSMVPWQVYLGGREAEAGRFQGLSGQPLGGKPCLQK